MYVHIYVYICRDVDVLYLCSICEFSIRSRKHGLRHTFHLRVLGPLGLNLASKTWWGHFEEPLTPARPLSNLDPGEKTILLGSHGSIIGAQKPKT